MGKKIEEKHLQEAIRNISPKQVDPQHPIGNQIYLAIKRKDPEAATLCALWAARLLDKSEQPNDKYSTSAVHFHNDGVAYSECRSMLKDANETIEILEPQVLHNNNIGTDKLISLGKAYNVTEQTNSTIDLLADYFDNEENPYNEDIAKILAEAYMDQKEYALADYVLADVIGNNPNDNQAKKMLLDTNKMLKEQQKAVDNTQKFEV